MKNIKQLRKEAKVTQTDLAERLGVDQSYISKLENGIIEVKDSVMQMKLSEALRVPLSDISPKNMPCSSHFPVVVHGQIIYDAGGFRQALVESAKYCKNCRKVLKDMDQWARELLEDPAFRNRYFKRTKEG